jgi:hypothetical protein
MYKKQAQHKAQLAGVDLAEVKGGEQPKQATGAATTPAVIIVSMAACCACTSHALCAACYVLRLHGVPLVPHTATAPTVSAGNHLQHAHVTCAAQKRFISRLGVDKQLQLMAARCVACDGGGASRRATCDACVMLAVCPALTACLAAPSHAHLANAMPHTRQHV